MPVFVTPLNASDSGLCGTDLLQTLSLDCSQVPKPVVDDTVAILSRRMPMVSPILNGSAGVWSTLEVLLTLKHVGIQSGPTAALHVHAYAWCTQVPGKPLGQDGVVAVWMAYVGMHEMLSSGQQGDREGSWPIPLVIITRCFDSLASAWASTGKLKQIICHLCLRSFSLDCA